MLRRAGTAVLAAMMTGLVLEGLLRMLPVSTATMAGYHHWPGVLTYPAHHAWQVSTGWDLRNPQALRANAAGFPAAREFVADPRAIGLVGDSYVEASMLDADDRPAAQLERLLPGVPVYGMGGPGSSLLDYAHRIEAAHRAWGLKTMVVMLEPGDLRQVLCGSGNVHSRCLSPDGLQPRVELQAAPGTLKAWLRHSALAQYLMGHVRLGSAAVWRGMFVRQTPEHTVQKSGPANALPAAPSAAAVMPLVTAALDEFYRQVPASLHQDLVFLVDGKRPGAAPLAAKLGLERRLLIDALKARGATVVDLEPVFAAHATRSSRRLEVGPHDGHLNALGVSLAMKAAVSVLRP